MYCSRLELTWNSGGRAICWLWTSIILYLINDNYIFASSTVEICGSKWPPAQVIRDSVISVVTVGWREDDVTEITRSRRQLRWRKVVHFLFIQITKTYSNLSPCCWNVQWSAENDSELRSQSAMRALRATTRAAILSVGLTKVRVVKMFNEAPKTIASFARNRLRARL